MDDSFTIPADMLDVAAAKKINARALVSIRDLIILLSTDEQLRDMDEQDAILKREPWRDKGAGVEKTGEVIDGVEVYEWRRNVDWSGTSFEKPKQEET